MFHIDSKQNKDYNTNNSNYQSEIISQVKEPQNDNNNKEKLDNNTKRGFFSFRRKKKEGRNKTSNVNPNTNNSNYQPEISSRLTELQDGINNAQKFLKDINDNLKNSPETNLNSSQQDISDNSSQQDISNNGPDTNFKIKGLELYVELNAFKDSDQKITNSENTTDLDNATDSKNTKCILKLSLESIEVAGLKKLIENISYSIREVS
jgi:hypothetical protein